MNPIILPPSKIIEWTWLIKLVTAAGLGKGNLWIKTFKIRIKLTLCSLIYTYYLNIFYCQAVAGSVLLYGCTTSTLAKRIEKKLDGKWPVKLRAIFNKSRTQLFTKQLLYGHLPPISKVIQVRQRRYVGYCWRSKDELISDYLLRTPSHGCASVGRPTTIRLLTSHL